MVDQDNIIKEIIKKKIDILGLSETKLTQRSAEFTFKDQNIYKVFHTCNDTTPRGAGVSILVHEKLAKNILKINKIEGYAIALHFRFKGKKKLCIIQVYLPNDKLKSTEIQGQIRKILKEESLNNTNIVVMGDFNATNCPTEDRSNNTTSGKEKSQENWKPEIPLFPFLEDLGFIDIHKCWEESTNPHKQISFTWSNKRASSRIDYIWLSHNIAKNIHTFKNQDFSHITNSDHTLLQVTIYSNEIIGSTKKAEKKRRKPRTIFDFKNMDKEKWAKYTQEMEKEFTKLQISNEIYKEKEKIDINYNNNSSNNNNQDQIQRLWNTIEETIKKIGKKYIPQKKINRGSKPQLDNNGHTSSFKDLRKATMILSIMKKFQKNPTSNLLNSIKEKVNELKKTQPLLDFNIFLEVSKTSEIPWSEWETNIKENIQAIKEINYREEMVIKEKEIKKSIMERCKDLETNQRKMINSLTDFKKRSITLDRILVKKEKEQDNYITTEPQEISKEIEKHYKNSFKTRLSSYDLLSEEWKKEYQPKKYVKEEWYQNLMDPVTEEELNISIKDLPNGKASGISTISYEMIKKLGKKAREILRNFFSLCLSQGTCPQSWKTSTIFPIPKPKEWECDLSNTRPIVLLETSRKLLTKILTNRLSTICKEHNVLKGPNYAGLPGESTQEPIQLLNNICEEAREKNKELWICFQDTAKAFDTVNLEMLKKAMERIKIPSKAIKFIINLFKNRNLKAITNFGLTESIIAGDSIDQGETISPLLWRIFYDPLLNKIQNNNRLGYTMESIWHPNSNSLEKEKMSLRIAATAFMDDTTWIASSKTNMQKILDDAAIFYKANDSQINGKKSILIAINGEKKNSDNTVYIGPEKEPLKKSEENEFARYLGIWIGEKDHKKFTIDLMEREIFQITHALEKKKTTDKQILYILNRVLIPRLEYRAQHCFLQKKECKSLTARYMGKFKNAINMSRTCPNSIVLHKGFYGLKSIEEIQTEALISNFTNRINDTGPMGMSTKIRLKDVQISEWEPSNIIKNYVPNLLKVKGNFQANVLALAHKLGIKYPGSDLCQIFDWKGGYHTIKSLINNQKEYKKATKHLAANNIMFIDQIIDKNNKRLINWQILTSLLNKNNKGRTPGWYNKIKQKITIEGSYKLNGNYENLTFINNVYKWTNTISNDNRRKEQIAFLSESQEIIIGKIVRKKLNDSTTKYKIIHLTAADIQEDSFKIVYCKGCNRSNQEMQEEETNANCYFEVEKSEIKGIKYLNNRKTGKNLIPYNYEAFTDNIGEELLTTSMSIQNTIQQIPNIIIKNISCQLIERWITTREHKERLTGQYNNNVILDAQTNKNLYEFYTDGSLKDRGNKKSLMGSAWIQTLGPNPGTTFQCSTINWPSSSKAEAIAIFTALLTIPEFREVEIFTDSQVCIDTHYKVQKSHPKFTKRRLLKIKNWTIWTKIKETIQSKNLKVKLTKVKAHNGDFFNEKADQLAKEALNSTTLEMSFNEAGPITAPPTWNNITIDMPVRDFIKEINKKAINKKWTEQNRNIKMFSQEIQNEEIFEWEAIWNKQNKNKHFTTPQNSQRKAFWIKLAQDELPTLDNLARRNPKTYASLQKCPLCFIEEETVDHLYTCLALRRELMETWCKTEEIFLKDKETSMQNQELNKKRQIIEEIKNKARNSPQNFHKLTIGMFEKEDIEKSKVLTGWSRNKCCKLVMEICDILREQFFKTIWKKRCKALIDLEKVLGIKIKEKRNKEIKHKRPAQIRRRNKANNPREKDKDNSKLSQPNQDHKKIEVWESIKDKIKDWVQFEKKWLGM